MKYLLTFNADYCDEFYVEAYTITDTREHYDYLIEHQDSEQAKEYGTVYVGFGSNEELEFDTISEFLDCVSIEEITDEQAKIVCSVIGDTFGLINPADTICDMASDLATY